jgi:5-methylcytosine-specific restriction protein A
MTDRFPRHSKKVTRTRRWRILRAAILERDGWRCTDCGARGPLEVHHELRVKDHPEAAFDPATLKSLCRACHTRRTRIECGHPPPPPMRAAWDAAVADLMPKKGTKCLTL